MKNKLILIAVLASSNTYASYLGDDVVTMYDANYQLVLAEADTVVNEQILFVDVGKNVILEAYTEKNLTGSKTVVEPGNYTFDPTGYDSFRVTTFPIYQNNSNVYLYFNAASDRCVAIDYFSDDLGIDRTYLKDICGSDEPEQILDPISDLGLNEYTEANVNIVVSKIDSNNPNYKGLLTGFAVEYKEGKINVINGKFIQPSGYNVKKTHSNGVRINSW